MGTHSDGNVEQELLTTFVTCEGDLSDPQFNTKFTRLLKQLQKLLLKGPEQHLGVVKVEPWNSVRVTFKVPKEGALRLRQLAQQRDVTLSQLGILSVQLEGDQAISLRIAGRVSGESQEIVLRTTPADTEGIGSQNSIPETDHHLISKSASGGTASLLRTMTQVLSKNQSLTEFKSPAVLSPSSAASPSAFTVPPKVSSTTVISTIPSKPPAPPPPPVPPVPPSYHTSPITTNNSSSAVVSTQSSFVNVGSTTGTGNGNYRFSTPPPPYPNSKVTTLQFIKSNRAVGEEAPKTPSPANVALSSPLLVNLLQNDGGGVAVNNSKIAAAAAAADRQKLKMAASIKSTAAKPKDGSLETFTNVKQLQSDGLAFVGLESDSQQQQQQVIQIQKASTSDPLTMVTNVQLPAAESCTSSESIIVSGGKLPTMNHLTAVTAKQNCPNASSIVQMFQRQISSAAAAAASSLPNQKVLMTSANLINNQLISRVAAGQGDEKFDVRLVNVPSFGQQLLQSSQQLLQKQQQWLQSSPQQQGLMQQQLITAQKSVMLGPQNVQGGTTKINVSHNALMVAGNRLVNQIPQSLPQPTTATLANVTESILTDREVQGMAAVTDPSVTGIVMTEGLPPRSDSGSLVQASSNGITSASLQLVKTFTFTNAGLTPNSIVTNNLSRSLASANVKLNPLLFGAVSTPDKASNIAQLMPPVTTNPAYNSPVSYQNTVVTNTSAVSTDKHFEQTRGSDLSLSLTDPALMFQTSTVLNSQQQLLPALNKPHPMLTYTSSMQLPNHTENSSGPVEKADSNLETVKSQSLNACGSEKEPQFLINPLTGEMEPMPETSDNESENQIDVFNSLPPSVANNEDSCFSFSPAEKSNSMYSDDNDDTDLPCKKELDHNRVLSAGSSPVVDAGGEKIKIRLKLPNNSAYKVDVLNTNTKKLDKPTSIVKPMPRVLTTGASSAASVQNAVVNAAADEPRVPPLRLNLRGKNYTFVKKNNNKKWPEDANDAVADDSIDKRAYFGKNQMSPNEVISEKECLSSDAVDLFKSVEGLEEADEIKSKPVKKKSVEEAAGETVSSYSPVLSAVRTFPTEAEVTSILRSVPLDGHNKMSLSAMKLKKKEAKKKTFARDRASMLTTSVAEEKADSFTRVINETKSTLSSQPKGKSKSNSSPLLKNVMKSSAAKGAMFMTLMSRNTEKRGPPGTQSGGACGEASGLNTKGGPVPGGAQQRRSSADSTLIVSATGGTALVGGRLHHPKVGSELSNPSNQYLSNVVSADSLYSNPHPKDKKLSMNAAGGKKANNSKSKTGNASKKSAVDMECCKQNVIVNRLQIESSPSFTGPTTLPMANLDLSEKVVKQRLLKDNSFGKPVRKKQRLDAADANCKNRSVVERLISLPNSNKESKVGSESPGSGVVASEQTNNQGEDSGIESMDALSEKSLNQGESPCRKEEKDSSVIGDSAATGCHAKRSPVATYCDKPDTNYGANPQQCERRADVGENKPAADKTDKSETSVKAATAVAAGDVEAFGSENIDKNIERSETMSPDLDDVQPFRVTPALYTYSNPEKIRGADSPSHELEDITDEITMSPKSVVVEPPKTPSSTATSTRLKRKRTESIDSIYVTMDKPKGTSAVNRYNNRNNVGLGGKSLLEQLLIDIPSDSNVDMRRSGVSTRNTRSQVKGLSQPSPDTLSVCSTSSSSSIKTPKCSPVPRAEDASSKLSPRPSSRLANRRSRKGSESSILSISDESNSSGVNKKKNLESVDLIKACIGFEDQNGKKIAVSALTTADGFRPIVSENSVVTASAVMVSTCKAGVGRPPGKRINAVGNPIGNSTATRPVGKRRKAANENPSPRKTNLAKSQPMNDISWVQDADSETQEHPEKPSSVSSTTPRNNRVNVSNAKQTPSTTPSTSRRSVRQNPATRRRKSVAPVAVDAVNASNSTISAATSNNNNSTNKNNNAGKIVVSKNELAPKSLLPEKNGILAKAAEKAESTNTTVRTRGHGIKQTLVVNESTTAAPQDSTGTHAPPSNEEGINVRRKTRSVANSNVSESEQGNKRRRNSKDGK